MMNKLIELKNLTKNFDDQQVLRGINLDIYEKEFLTLLGPSGCGKTTVTGAILQAFRQRGISLAPYKCGPDYIDPMFHREITGNVSVNLDGVFLSPEKMREIFMLA